MRRPADAYWFALKDQVKQRCRSKCEYCQLRHGQQLHHRSYVHKGAERLEDVMLVCESCHKIIHGLKSCGLMSDGSDAYSVAAGSLADRGDRGHGLTEQWEKYLHGRASK